jgi:hypothetical protein
MFCRVRLVIVVISLIAISTPITSIECPGHQQQFDEGIKALHSFWYNRANQIFTNITQQETKCSMAHWGIAMCQWYPLWVNPNPEHIETAKQHLLSIIYVPQPHKEQKLTQTLFQFFNSSTGIDQSIEKYHDGMYGLMQEYPGDIDLVAFYVLSILALGKVIGPSDQEFELRVQAGRMLKKKLNENPDHVGLLHYLIHTYDHPFLSTQSVEASRHYPQVAPEIPHALHMPSHTHQHLGQWSESILANTKSISSTTPNTNYPGQLHSLGFLVNALLQKGQVSKVEELVKYIQNRDIEFGILGVSEAFDLVSIPVKHALNVHNWKMATQIELLPRSANWSMHSWVLVYKYFSRVVGHFFLNNKKLVFENYRLMVESHRHGQLTPSWTYVPVDLKLEIETMMNFTKSLVLFANDSNMHTLDQMFDSFDPWIHSSEFLIVPFTELFAQILLSNGKRNEARQMYETTLDLYPNRLNSLYGMAITSGQKRMYFDKVLSLCDKHESYICPSEFCKTGVVHYRCTERHEIVVAKKYFEKRLLIGLVITGSIVVLFFLVWCLTRKRTQRFGYMPIQ